ncbi:SUKH-4 family immunity protein [Streptomyces sp. NBC_00470]|uniref:SUKH-4 family immunity protein n=1 Tax=Streptomyces sp. NBC_00470 TaxID=2975753 RepID=UPI0030E10A70
MSMDLDAVLADPARLLTADRAQVRERIAAEPSEEGAGREVFLQAEAIFGSADVSAAEFASWLHFAATATGHDEYAARVLAAEPGMPWRTRWAWWRPAGWFVAQPSLNGDYFEVRCRRQGAGLVEVVDHRGLIRLDGESGRRVPVPPLGREGGTGESAVPLEELGPAELYRWDLTAPESWQAAVAWSAEEGRACHLVVDPHGIAMLETDAEVLRNWPQSAGIDTSSSTSFEFSQSPPLGAAPRRKRPVGPLTAARIDDAFGAGNVLRVPDSALPEALEHPESRRHLRDVGIPARWACHGVGFTSYAPEELRPATTADDLPQDLIGFGTCDYGDLYVHGRDGSVHIRSRLEGPTNGTLVHLAPDLDVFTRVLEAVYRYSNACWHPYPVEGEQETVVQDFLDELEALAPGFFAPQAPSGVLWSWIWAGITELDVDGF